MARGWESKSVEEQQSQFSKPTSTDGKGQRSKEQVAKAQRAQELRLARVYAEDQMRKSQNERHREMLKKQIEFLDSEIARLS
ncbi:MAG TPA: hypothetical protein VN577_12285 [Terriglobales bacterium]|nr:hypothetical protein [Terriglobales bacterium]